MSEVLPIIKWTEGRMKPWRSDFILPNDGEYAPLHEVGGRRNDRHSYVTVVLDDAKAEAIEEAYAGHHWYREGIEAVLDILGVEFLGDPRGMDELHIRNLTTVEEQSRYSYAYLVNLWEGPGTYFIDVNHGADLLDLEHAEHLTYECADVDEWIAAVERWFGGIVIAGKVEDDHDADADDSEKVDEAQKMTAAERFIERFKGWRIARKFVESCGEDTFDTVDDWDEAFDSYLTGLTYGV